jgi:hypothetical protein
LTPAQEAAAVARRNEIYEALHPETVHGERPKIKSPKWRLEPGRPRNKSQALSDRAAVSNEGRCSSQTSGDTCGHGIRRRLSNQTPRRDSRQRHRRSHHLGAGRAPLSSTHIGVPRQSPCCIGVPGWGHGLAPSL